MRVRCFTQDDAHIFMTPEQVKDEIKGVVKLLDEVYSLFGFEYHIELSTMQMCIRDRPFTMGGGTYARHFKCAVSFGMEEPGEPAPEWVGPMHGPDEGVSEALRFKALKIYILAIPRLMQLEF